MSFRRAYKLTVGNILIDASEGVTEQSLRVAFRVERDLKRVPNDAQLTVFNLTREHREGLAQLHNVPVLLQAGYVDDGLGTVFLGDLRNARTQFISGDYYTTISGGDGENKLRVAKLNRTFRAGTPLGSVIADLGKALGVDTGNIASASGAALLNGGSTTLPAPLVVSGAVYYSLEKVCRSCGLTWSIQDSVLQIAPDETPTNSGFGPRLTPQSGLLGQVETEIATETKNGLTKGQTLVTFNCQLRTDLVPGQACRVESQNFTGNLKVRSVTHQGDSHRSDDTSWITSATGVPY